MPLNHRLKDLRISKEMDELLTEVADKLGFKKTHLARILLNKSLNNLRHDIIKYGIDNLSFELKPI